MNFFFPHCNVDKLVWNCFSKVAHCEYTRYYPECNRINQLCSSQFRSVYCTLSSNTRSPSAWHQEPFWFELPRMWKEHFNSLLLCGDVSAESVCDISVFCRARVAFARKMSSGKIQLEQNQDVLQLLSKRALHFGKSCDGRVDSKSQEPTRELTRQDHTHVTNWFTSATSSSSYCCVRCTHESLYKSQPSAHTSRWHGWLETVDMVSGPIKAEKESRLKWKTKTKALLQTERVKKKKDIKKRKCLGTKVR